MDNLIRLQDLVDNPTARVPICLCLDTSGSMSRIIRGDVQQTGERVFKDGQYWNIVTGGVSAIDDLNQGIREFYDELRQDEVAQFSAEICIVTFGGTQPRLVMDFANISRQPELPTLIAEGETPMGEAVNMALDCLEKRKQEYRDKGVDYYQPWLVLMTDGENKGNAAEFERAVSRTVELINSSKLTIFPIAITSDDAAADQRVLQTLGRFSPRRAPMKIGKTKFSEFFQWLSQSVSRTSVSMPGEKVPLDLEGLKGWAEL